MACRYSARRIPRSRAAVLVLASGCRDSLVSGHGLGHLGPIIPTTALPASPPGTDFRYPNLHPQACGLGRNIGSTSPESSQESGVNENGSELRRENDLLARSRQNLVNH